MLEILMKRGIVGFAVESYDANSLLAELVISLLARWLEYKEGVAERDWEGFWAEIGKVAYLMKLTEPIKPIIANLGCAALFKSFGAF